MSDKFIGIFLFFWSAVHRYFVALTLSLSKLFLLFFILSFFDNSIITRRNQEKEEEEVIFQNTTFKV